MGQGGVCGGFVVEQGAEKEKPNGRVNRGRNEVSVHLEEHLGLVFGLQLLRGWLQLCRRGSVVVDVSNHLAGLRGEQGENES